MNLNGLKVVLPTAEELKGMVLLAPDFSMACGVKYREFFYDEVKNAICFKSKEFFCRKSLLNYAYTLTSTVMCLRREKHDCDYLPSDELHRDDKYVYDYRIAVKYPDNNDSGKIKSTIKAIRAGNHSLGIAPKIKHPELINMTVETEPNQKIGIIKIGDKIPTTPQSFVGLRMSEKLEKLFRQGELQQTGQITVDQLSMCYNHDTAYNTTNDDSMEFEQCPRFTYQGAEYVRKETVHAQMISRDYPNQKSPIYENGRFQDGTIAEPVGACWFLCEPYQAIKNPDGSITCLTVVCPGQLEVETKFEKTVGDMIQSHPRYQSIVVNGGEFSKMTIHLQTEKCSLSKYLNQIFLREMLQSVGMKIVQEEQQNVDREKD